MEALRSLSLGAPSFLTAILEAENRKKWKDLNRDISVSTDIDEKRLVVFKRTINHFFSGCIGLPRLGYNIFLFFLFFVWFFQSDLLLSR